MDTEAQAGLARDYEARAREILPTAGFQTHFGEPGAVSWETNTKNLAAFANWVIRPRILSGVTAPCLETLVLGKLSAPFLLAPVGGQQRFHPEGELASFRAAQEGRITAVLSTMATFSIEEVAAAAPDGRRWFQVYVMRDRAITQDLVHRAEAAGYEAIVLTVDNISGHLARPRRYWLNGLSGPGDVIWPALDKDRTLANFRYLRGTPSMPPAALDEFFDGSFCWGDLDWLRSITRLPIVLKGVQVAEDALLAVEHGLDGIVVSNHGGVPAAMEDLGSTLQRLPAIAEAVDGRLEIFLDGGVRRGADIFKAIALGARAVMLGRSFQWALAAGGRGAVLDQIGQLREELASTMVLAGLANIADAHRGHVELARTDMHYISQHSF